jgi:outer membrane protein assembly factor BamB
MLVARFLPSIIGDGPTNTWMFAAFGPFLLGVAIVIWYLAASRLAWREKLTGLLGGLLLLILVIALMHPSVRGPLVVVMTIPMGIAAFVLGLSLARRNPPVRRLAVSLLTAGAAMSVSDLVLNQGAWGDFSFDLKWRWADSAEDRFLAKHASSSSSTTTQTLSPTSLQQPEWPGFRGPQRNGVQQGTVFSNNWFDQPPEELWRIPVGPAWSSFVYAGGYLFTQEQRGDAEAVVCYDAKNGREIWSTQVASRFFEGLGGLGPRATPTIHEGSIYAMGAEGWLQRLDATNGKLVWTVDLRVLANRAPPMWGFSSSPWVGHGVVAVHAAGKSKLGVVAVSTEDGRLKWSASAGENSYGTLQSVSIEGRELLALLSDDGVHLLNPTDGVKVSDYVWKHPGYRSLQPTMVDDNKMLIPTGLGSGTRLVQWNWEGDRLDARELWTSRELKPDFNDLVVHQGFAYGFDNNLFACIDLANGGRRWKGGRYGKGQVLLLADSELLLVISEQGELVLIQATPDAMKELARIRVFQEKTWNHPIVVEDRLFLRNAAEAVCYRLAIK